METPTRQNQKTAREKRISNFVVVSGKMPKLEHNTKHLFNGPNLKKKKNTPQTNFYSFTILATNIRTVGIRVDLLTTSEQQTY